MLRRSETSLGKSGRDLAILAAILVASAWGFSACDQYERVLDYIPDRIDPNEECPLWTYVAVPRGQCPPVECRCSTYLESNGVFELLEEPPKPGEPGGKPAAPRLVVRTNIVWLKCVPGVTRQDVQEIADRLAAAVVYQAPAVQMYILLLPTAELRAVDRILQALRRDPLVEHVEKDAPAVSPEGQVLGVVRRMGSRTEPGLQARPSRQNARAPVRPRPHSLGTRSRPGVSE